MNIQILSKMLLCQEQLSDEKWIAFLTLVHIELNPNLDKFTLKKFGDLACIPGDDMFYNCLSVNNPNVRSDFGFSLETRGIVGFCDDGIRLSEVNSTRQLHAWGLTKSGRWVFIEVSIELLNCSSGDGTWEHARSVRISDVSLAEMLERSGIKPYSVWRVILMEIENWEGRRLRSYEEARKQADHFRVLDIMLTGIILKPKTA